MSDNNIRPVKISGKGFCPLKTSNILRYVSIAILGTASLLTAGSTDRLITKTTPTILYTGTNGEVSKDFEYDITSDTVLYFNQIFNGGQLTPKAPHCQQQTDCHSMATATYTLSSASNPSLAYSGFSQTVNCSTNASCTVIFNQLGYEPFHLGLTPGKYTLHLNITVSGTDNATASSNAYSVLVLAFSQPNADLDSETAW